jgi:NitT/TauT family transport system substrate-binding protein
MQEQGAPTMTHLTLDRRRVLQGALGAAAVSILPGRGAFGNDLVEITAAQAVETMYYLPLYVAHAKGFFEDEGLDVTIYNAQQRTVAARAVASGDAFSYNGDPAEPALVRQRGVDMRNIGVLVNRAAQVVLGQPDVSDDPKDWAGKKIIIPRPPHTAVSLIRMTLIEAGYEKADADGLVWASDAGRVNLVPVVAGSELSALLSGQADLAVVLEPQTSNGVNEGLEIKISFPEQFGPFFFTSFAVLQETIETQPDRVQAFANAITKAMQYGHQNPDGAAEVAVKRYSDSDPAVMRSAAKRIISQGAYPESLVVSRQAYDNNFNKLLPATGHDAAGYPFDELMNLTFAEKAAEKFDVASK